MKRTVFMACAASVMLALVLMSFASNPFADYAATDSAVFYFIGKSMHSGVVPYRDVFDHKGMLIYAINWLGSFIGTSLLGVWIIETIAFLFTFAMIWRFLSRWIGYKDALLCLFPYSALFAYCNNAGNFTETYAHFFIVPVCLTLYSCAKKGMLFGRLESFMAGCCFSAVLFLRPNMEVFALVTAIYFAFSSIRNRAFCDFAANTAMVLLGMACFSLPMILYLYYNDALAACWNCYIVFNIEYAKGTSCGGTGMLLAYALLALGAIPCFDNSWKRAGIFNFAFIALTALLLQMNSAYKHYFMMIVPGAILPIAYIVHKVSALRMSRYSLLLIVIGSTAFVAKEAAQSNFDLKGLLLNIRRTHSIKDFCDYKESAQYAGIKSFSNQIHETNSVLMVGNDCGVYRMLGVRPKGYYVYLPDAFNETDRFKISQAITSQINRYAITNSRYVKPWHYNLVANAYSQIATAGTYTLWESNRSISVD